MTRTSRFFVKPPPFIGPPIEPCSSHPHTLTPSQEGSHWVFFHFQQSRDELVWVTVVSKATIFLALCLHSAVDELLRQRSNKPIRKPSENVSKGQTQQENILMRAKIVYMILSICYSYLFVPSPSTFSPSPSPLTLTLHPLTSHPLLSPSPFTPSPSTPQLHTTANQM